MKIRIGSRGSDLALWQAHHIQSLLKRRTGTDSEVVVIRTKGDHLEHLSFNQIEGKGFFTREIEEALLVETIDLAVHSLKDLPTETAPGLEVAAFSEREDPRDVLLIHPDHYDPTLKPPLKSGARIGTSSNRRKKQMENLRPDAQVVELRGNVPTRVQRLREHSLDAVIMAYAGLKRLNLDLSFFHKVLFEPEEFIPNPAQGILGLQVRSKDEVTKAIVRKLNDSLSESVVRAERGLLARMQGGCQLALGAYARRNGAGYRLNAFWDELNGRPSHRFEADGPDPDDLARRAYYAFMKSSRKLKEKTVVLTRPEPQAGDWMREIESFGARVISYPTIRIVPTIEREALRTALGQNYDWFLFTSANAVDVFFAAIRDLGMVLPHGVRVAAIGLATGDAVRREGHRVDFMPGKATGADLAAEWADLSKRPNTVLLPCGSRADTTIEDRLRSGGHTVYRVNLYDTLPTEVESLPSLEGVPVDYLVFASPSAFENFQSIRSVPPGARIISIGPKTSRRIRGAGVEFVEAEEQTIESIILKMLS
jgi:hydroxymethylbilane synthase